jgi:hypothetical protein
MEISFMLGSSCGSAVCFRQLVHVGIENREGGWGGRFYRCHQPWVDIQRDIASAQADSEVVDTWRIGIAGERGTYFGADDAAAAWG